MAQNIKLESKLTNIHQILLKRREACMDMVQVLSEHLNEPINSILLKSGIDPEEYYENIEE
jgi:hypothetical protein